MALAAACRVPIFRPRTVGSRARRLCTNSTVRTADRIQTLLSQGNVFSDFTSLANEHGAMNLGQGFPSFGSPPFLGPLLADACKGDVFQESGQPPENFNNQYTKPGEEPLLANVLAEEYSDRFGRTVVPGNVCTTVGAQEGIFTTLSAFCNPGDEIVVVTPAFDSYFKSASVLGLAVKACPMTSVSGETPTDAGEYTLDPEMLRATLSADTKLLLLNTPSSPLGKVFTPDELLAIADVVKDFPNMVVLSDEVYEHMVFDGKRHAHIAALQDRMWNQTVSVFSAGKTFSCTGWRLGYIIGPEHLIHPIKTLHAAINFSTTTPLQKSTAQAFSEAKKVSYFDWLPRILQEKRDVFCAGLTQIGVPFVKPEGGYFLVADVSMFYALAGIDETGFDRILPDANLYDRPDVRFCEWLTKEVGVAPIPMSPFYTPEQRHLANNFVRFAYCKDDRTLNTAVERLEAKLK